MRLAEVFNVSEWEKKDVHDKGTSSTQSTPIPTSGSDEPVNIPINKSFNASAWNSHVNYREAGCFSAPVIGILIILIIVIALTTGRVGIPGPLLWIVALAMVNWLATIKYRRSMEKRLGRKVKGDYELTSISSWMEASSKEERPRVKTASPNITPERSAQKNPSELNKTFVAKSDEKAGEESIQVVGKVGDRSEVEGNFDEPRLYHYIFAHRYLPEKLRENPSGVRMWLTGEKGVEHLKIRWGLLRMAYKVNPDDYFEPEGMNRYILRPTPNHTIIIVQFPPPKRMTEAFYGAIVFWPDNRYRYFTLELTEGMSPDGSPRTVVGEWADLGHANYGEGPSPNPEAFLNAVIERIDL